jgi:hypothetical protein
MNGILLLLLHSPWNFGGYLLELNLNLSYREQKFIDSWENFHEIWCQNQIYGPAHLKIEWKITPDIPVMTRRLWYHLPLLNLCLTIKTADVWYEAYIGSIHLKSQIVGQSYRIYFCYVLFKVFRVERIYWKLELAIIVVYFYQVRSFI